MKQTLSLVRLLPFIASVNLVIHGALSSCPWDDSQLKKWSDPNTWLPNEIPRENDTVFIPADTKIVLDKPVPRLLTLTINGTLVWGNVDGIRLETSYILVNGEFHIGSEECNFEKTADIYLYGKSNSNETVQGFGRKFIGANKGSVLEIHGKKKKSWSKLVATVSPVSAGPCGIKYDSRNRYIKKRRGIWINVWNPDSSLYHLETFETIGSRAANSIARIVEIIKKTPFGKVISLAVYKTLGTPSAVFEDFYLAVEGLGSSLIRKVGEYEPYVIIAEKGKANCLIEKLTKRPEGVTGGLDASATFTLGDIAFMSRSYSEVSQKNDKAIFRALTRDSAYPKLSLLHDVSSWETGDEVVVASTDFDWRQYEVKTIVECPDCEPNQIRVDGDFKYSHFGEVTYGVDERAEVGLLSRNIRIDAEMQNECYFDTEEEEYVCKLLKRDTFGGHTKVLNSAWARIEGVQLTHMGQQSVLATYPLHFHLADSVKGQYLRNNVIRDSNSRCITIHGTDYLEVSDNVCLNHLGHGMFLEDSAEQNNTIHRNLIIGTQYGTLLPTDKNANWCKDRSFCDVLSTFWITHPNNYFTENVAAGSDGSGMVFAFSDRPLGPSRKRLERRGLYEENSTRYMKVGKFHRNVMHSNKLGGLWFDNRVSYGQWDMNKFVPENARMSLNLYTPKDPPKPGGKAIETELSGLTLYKNEDRNSWVRCGNIVITNSSFADSITSYIGAHTVDGTYCAVRNSIFIGETENKGRPYTHVFNDKKFSYLPKSKRPVHRFDRAIPRGRPSYMISGVTFYQGPVYIENCFFDRFTNWYYNDSFIDTWGIRPMRPAAALNFHPNNHYPMIPRNAIKNVTFGFCNARHNSFQVMDGNASTPWWNVFDGTGNIIFRDLDGSLTLNKDTAVVDNRPFFNGPRCSIRPDWGLAICPYKYVQMVIRGKTGVLHKKFRGKTPVLINRDDKPEDVYVQTGATGHKYNLRVLRSYTVKFNSTLGPPPRDIQFRPKFGLENNEMIRIAVCLPKSTNKFTIYSTYPQLHPKRKLFPKMVNSLKDLNRDTTMKAFFWDKEEGYLYFKMRSPYSLTRPGQVCPGDVCLDVNIIRADGGNEPAVCDTLVTPYFFRDRSRKIRNRDCEPATSQGLGAPIETGFEPPPPSDENCN